MSGEVRDSISHKPLPLASIIILGTSIGAATDEEGRFTIESVPLGSHDVLVIALGYDTVIVRSVIVTPGGRRSIRAALLEHEIAMAGVTVTGDKVTETREMPLSLHALSLQQIRHDAGSLDDIARVVANLPGVAQVYGTIKLAPRGSA
ncbi:MAG: carboxypeptidase-like regulatory domain-containing protein [Ignavibacteriales bacterium]|nr:carboxypeptidase-like regulatory domain-containing protein [Ignavibacteriales bacterium]